MSKRATRCGVVRGAERTRKAGRAPEQENRLDRKRGAAFLQRRHGDCAGCSRGATGGGRAPRGRR